MLDLKQLLLDKGVFIDNEYLDKYVELIYDNIDTPQEIFITNSHHIIPRYHFRSHNQPIDNSPSNKVNLKYRDHMLAHLYMSGCSTGRHKYWNLYAIFRMSGRKEITIDDIKFIQSLDFYQKLYTEAVTAAPNHRKGVKCSEETRRKMSEAQKNRVRTNKNVVWVHNTEEEIMVSKSDLDTYICKGYERGRLFRHSEETKKLLAIKSAQIPRDETFCKKMSEIAKRQLPPTPERRQAQSLKMKEYYSTHDNPFLHKHHSNYSKQLMREANIDKIKINNGTIEKMVKLEDLPRYNNGEFIFGRIGMSRDSICVFVKGDESVHIRRYKAIDYILDGWTYKRNVKKSKKLVE